MVAPLSIIENYIKPSHWSTHAHISRDIDASALPYRYRVYQPLMHTAWINKSGVYSQIFLIFIDIVQLQNMRVFYELQNSYFSFHL